MNTQNQKRCETCKFFCLKSKQWGDCLHTRIHVRLQGKQHKDNGGNCPHYGKRSES